MNTSSSATLAQSPSPYIDSPAFTAIILPLLAFATLIIDTPCFIWHATSRNLAASLLVGWIMLQNLIVFVNATIWPTDNLETFWHGQGYCDVIVKLDWMGGAAITAATTCIMRALAAALDTKRTSAVSGSYSQRLQNRLLVYGLCVGFPIYMGIAAFIVQPQRYYIYAISGCVMVEWHSLATIFLCYIPPLMLMVATCYYAVLTIVRLRRYKRDIASVLASTDSGLSRTRFMRLLGLALVLLLIYTPLFIVIVVQEEAVELFPFDWSQIHNPDTFNQIIVVQTYGQARIDRWVRVSTGFVVFACFGFGRDIKATYRKCLQKIGLKVLIPLLRLDDNDSPTHGNRRRSGRNPRLSSLSSQGSIGSFKSRAKRVMSKLSMLSRSSGSTTNGTQDSYLTSASGAEKLAMPSSCFETPSNPASAAHLSELAGSEVSEHARPSGLTEKDLIEQENSKPTYNLNSATPAIATVNRDSVTTALPVFSPRDQEPQGLYQASHSEALASETHPRSRFWQRLSAYVHSMGPRPANNLGVVRGHSPERYAAGVQCNAFGSIETRMSELDVMRDRGYERHVVDRLA